ncbi:hypothetical protein F5X68DRAFT_272878 [Plectosphaerella plurivora]|uniref:NAD-dependent epimerase/dehydratase domain-containing protein n=1 Tax=Plectosphaerella plurivora TaxID=936078 RepID=A0A9P8VL98_9PEZI|nr:hypothetical protein F5X68DRAFT_272878 [Plectosphaerella plurivora]
MSSQLTLITGVSGFVGFRVLAEALSRGRNVRAVIRKPEQAERIKNTESVRPHVAKLEFSVVPDLLLPGAFDEVLHGVTEIIHVASPLPSSVPDSTDFQRDIVEPAIRGTMGVLESATKISSIRRVVVTSSMAAFLDMTYFVTPDDTRVFNAQSRTAPPGSDLVASNAALAYCAAKATTLNATDRFIEERQPIFDIVNILPSLVVGKHELNQTREEVASGTNLLALGVLLSTNIEAPSPGASVHIDDVARTHLDALDPSITGHRNYMCSSGGLEGTVWEDAKDIARKYFPKHVDDGTLSLSGTNTTKPIRLDSSATEEAFGWKFQSYEEQVKCLIEHYVSLPSSQ